MDIDNVDDYYRSMKLIMLMMIFTVLKTTIKLFVLVIMVSTMFMIET